MHALRTTLLATFVAAAPPAWAQTSPEQQAQPPASAPRLDAGVEIESGYVDNLFATRNREEDDFLFLLRPFARFDLGAGENFLTVRGEGEIGRHADFDSEDYEDWLVAANGRTRVSTNLSLVGGAEWRWSHEDRSSPEAVSGLTPTQYQRGFGYAGLLLSSGRFRGRLAGTVTRFDFADVATNFGFINNDDRDRTQMELGGRAGVRLSSATELFLQGAYDQRDYDDGLDDSGFRRDSEGGSLAAGIQRDFGNGFSGEVFAGWLHQDYRDPRLVDIDAPDFGAVLDWNGLRGIGGSLSIDRTVEETTLAAASGYIMTSGRLSLRASPHPRLSAGVGLSGTHYDYRGSGRTEFVLGGDLWARFWLNRRLFVGARYIHAQRSSNAAGFDFDQNRFMVSLGARLRPTFSADAEPFLLSGHAPGGFYGGLLAGHGTLVAGLDGPRQGGQGSNTADFGDHGAGAVAVLGYGVLLSPLYLGVEAEASVAGPDWSHTADRVFSMGKENAFGVAARIGLATPRGGLIYGRFGVNSAELRTDYTHSGNVFSGSERRAGLGIGGGIEVPAGRRGFVRAEYVVTSFGDEDVPTGGGEFDNFSASESQFRIGGGIRFGTPAARAADGPSPTRFGGFYAGLHLGHGALTTDNQGMRSGGTAIDISRASHGASIGAFAGLGYLVSRIYLGAEVEGDVSAINWNIERDPNGRIYSSEHDYSFGATVRAGVLLGDEAMIYSRLGAVRTRFDTPYSTTNLNVRSQETRTGIRFGGGLEIGVSERVRVRVDYSLTDYERYDVEYGTEADRFDHSETLFRLAVLLRL